MGDYTDTSHTWMIVGTNVGLYEDHGFLLHQGSYTSIDDPKGGVPQPKGIQPFGSYASSINGLGDIVGHYTGTNGNGTWLPAAPSVIGLDAHSVSDGPTPCRRLPIRGGTDNLCGCFVCECALTPCRRTQGAVWGRRCTFGRRP